MEEYVYTLTGVVAVASMAALGTMLLGDDDGARRIAGGESEPRIGGISVIR